MPVACSTQRQPLGDAGRLAGVGQGVADGAGVSVGVAVGVPVAARVIVSVGISVADGTAVIVLAMVAGTEGVGKGRVAVGERGGSSCETAVTTAFEDSVTAGPSDALPNAGTQDDKAPMMTTLKSTNKIDLFTSFYI